MRQYDPFVDAWRTFWRSSVKRAVLCKLNLSRLCMGFETICSQGRTFSFRVVGYADADIVINSLLARVQIELERGRINLKEHVLVLNEFILEFSYYTYSIEKKKIKFKVVKTHQSCLGTSGILRLRAMTASLRGRFSVTSDLTEKRYKKVARQVLFSRFLRLEVGVVVKYRYGNCNIAI